MGTETQNPRGQPKPTAPGKPASRQPPDSNTGQHQDRDELPGEGGGDDQVDRSRSADNP